MNREEKYYSCGLEHNVEKMERGSNIIFPIILRLLGRISSGEEDGNVLEENGGVVSCKDLIHP